MNAQSDCADADLSASSAFLEDDEVIVRKDEEAIQKERQIKNRAFYRNAQRTAFDKDNALLEMQRVAGAVEY